MRDIVAVVLSVNCEVRRDIVMSSEGVRVRDYAAGAGIRQFVFTSCQRAMCCSSGKAGS
jgi:hypothetical protein